METQQLALEELPKKNGIAKHTISTPFINIQERENFLKDLNARPDRVEKSQGQETIPISFLENLLDETYMGLWQTENFRFQVVANEIIGTIDLSVFDPTAKIWITRSGSAAVMIRQASGSAITDIGAKIKNGLAMDFPKLESMCLKAAAKRLGKKFGRDLNRKFEDEYETLYSNKFEVDELRPELEKELKACTHNDALLAVWGRYSQYHSNPELKKLFNSYKSRLDINKV